LLHPEDVASSRLPGGGEHVRRPADGDHVVDRHRLRLVDETLDVGRLGRGVSRRRLGDRQGDKAEPCELDGVAEELGAIAPAAVDEHDGRAGTVGLPLDEIRVDPLAATDERDVVHLDGTVVQHDAVVDIPQGRRCVVAEAQSGTRRGRRRLVAAAARGEHHDGKERGPAHGRIRTPARVELHLRSRFRCGSAELPLLR
jgi:hypothetical protein